MFLPPAVNISFTGGCTFLMASLTCCSFVMSMGRTSVLMPNRSHSIAVVSSSAFVRDRRATLAPVSAKAMAVAFPIPRPAPYYELISRNWDLGIYTSDECDLSLE